MKFKYNFLLKINEHEMRSSTYLKSKNSGLNSFKWLSLNKKSYDYRPK